MRGQPTYVRCRRCQRDLPHEWSDYGGAYEPRRHVNAKAFEVVRTGRTRLDGARGLLHEYVCALGHRFWSSDGRGDLQQMHA